MLNRHAIVLFLGLAAMLPLRGVPEDVAFESGSLRELFSTWRSVRFFGLLPALVTLLLGLLLDTGEPARPRTRLGHLLQLGGIALLAIEAVPDFVAGWSGLHLALGELGIALAAAGVLAEMYVPLSRLKAAAAVQVVGDVAFLAGLAVAFFDRLEQPRVVGWVFVALFGGLSVYAAVRNVALQLGRMRDPQHGWRFRVLEVTPEGIRLRTPGGEQQIPRRHVEAVTRLDARHLLLVLPSPLPPELEKSDLPFEELRQSADALHQGTPDRYGFILHEQELGRAVDDAERALMAR